LLRAIAEIVGKIDIWWIREVDIPTNPDFDATQVDDIDLSSTFSMRMAFLDLLLQVADGDDQNLMQLYKHFKEQGTLH